MQAKLHNNLYDLAENGIHQTASSDGANNLTLDLLNVTDLDTLQHDATDCEEILIMDGETEVGCYYDYVNFKGLTVDEGGTHVTTKQDSIVRQVAKLRQTVATQAEVIATQEATIEAQAATIEAQEAEIASLTESQATQDENIELIGDAVLEISEVVYE